jgi:hypothetical protein
MLQKGAKNQVDQHLSIREGNEGTIERESPEVAQRKLARMARSADGAETRGWLSKFASSASELVSHASSAARSLVAKPAEPQQQCC